MTIQTVLIKLTMESRKVRAKAMKIAVGVSAVESVSIKGKDKDELEVKGDGIDTVKLTMLLRKNVGHASIVSVEEDKKDDKKDEVKIQHMVHGFGVHSYACYEVPHYQDQISCHGFGVHPYACYEVPSNYQDQISCSIM
ncbi:heavy metal-associated isoprenylated plant protein 46-like [Fagus crenata]